MATILVNEPSSTETMTSRASIVSASEVIDDPITSSALTPEKQIATQSLTGRNHVTRIYSKSPHYLPLACLALCLNPPLGIPALVCAFLSRKSRLSGHEQKAAQCSQWALWLSLVGIAMSLVIIIFSIVYVHVITPNIIRHIEGLPGGGAESLPDVEDEIIYFMENTTVASSL